MRRFALFLTLLAAISAADAKVISVASFGAVPDDGIDDAPALRKAAEYCRTHSGTTLEFPQGVYNFHDDEAAEIERKAQSGEWGGWIDVSERLFRHDAPYVKGLDFTGARDLTIKGRGATLLVDGWMQVITLTGTKNATIEGLTIAMSRPGATVGRVVSTGPDSFEIEYDPKLYTYTDSLCLGRSYMYSKKRDLIYTGWVRDNTVVRPGRVRFNSKAKPETGDFCVLRNGGHYRPSILIKEADNTTLRDVRIMDHAGMGVVGHMSHNITLDGLQVVPQPDRVASTTTDATHFTSCTGLITLRNCKFRGQGDDCTNIHNYYYHFYPQKDGRTEIRVEGADLHALSLDYPMPGDTMLVINRKNMAEMGKFRVKKVDTSEADWTVFVTFDRPLPEGSDTTCYMANLTRSPRVLIENNTVDSHLARAFLIKTNKEIIIRGNYIRGSTMSAIKLGGEIGWHESGPVEDVLIEGNYISNCGIACGDNDGSCVRTSTESPETPPYVNRNITIRDNVFQIDNPIAIYLEDAEKVNIYGNLCNQPDYVKTSNCGEVNVAY